MLSVQRLINETGNVDRAHLILLDHYTAKHKSRYQGDLRYATMEFELKWGNRFRRHDR
jgi:hypothetical protein